MTGASAPKPLLGPRSSRVLSVVLLVGGAVAIAAMALLMVFAVTRGSVNTMVTLSSGTRIALDQSLGLPAGLGLAGDQIPLRLTVDTLPTGTRLLVALGTALPYLCGGLAAIALSRVVWGLGSGTPFQQVHVRLLVVVAGLWAVGSYVTPQLVRGASAAALDHAGSPAGLEPAVDTSSLLVTWFGLLVLLAVAEVFRRGARQARDVDGLV